MFLLYQVFAQVLWNHFYNNFKLFGLANKTDGSEDNLIKIEEFLSNELIELNEEEEYQNTLNLI